MARTLFISIACIIVVAFVLLQNPGRAIHPAPSPSPAPVPQSSSPSQSWLIATMTPYQSLQRRAIIRATWQRLYGGRGYFTTRFVISRPSEHWRSIIASENATYGDMFIMEKLPETRDAANSIKSIEFFKELFRSGEHWDFVSKIDDDTFVDAKSFHKIYLSPLMSELSKHPDSKLRTVIGREIGRKGKKGHFSYPQGGFYTLSWDIVGLLATLHDKDPIQNEYEDVLIGRLLHEAQEDWRLVEMPREVAFDYKDDEGSQIAGKKTAWAKFGADLNLWEHAVGPHSISPHNLKKDEHYLRVASCFGPDGLLHYPWKNRLALHS